MIDSQQPKCHVCEEQQALAKLQDRLFDALTPTFDLDQREAIVEALTILIKERG